MRFDFGIRDTPKGCVAWMKTPKRTQEQRFRNGYASARESAKKWIKERIIAIREAVEVDGMTKPDVFVEGVRIDL